MTAPATATTTATVTVVAVTVGPSLLGQAEVFSQADEH